MRHGVRASDVPDREGVPMTAFPAEPFDGVQEITVEAAPSRSCGIRTPPEQPPGRLRSRLRRAGPGDRRCLVLPAGPALAVYHGDPMGVFDLDIGFPVATLGEVLSVDGVEIAPPRCPRGRSRRQSHRRLRRARPRVGVAVR
jgi:hypothetical protein